MKAYQMALAGLLVFTCDAAIADSRSFYDIQAIIVPESRQLEVTLELDYVNPSDKTNSVAFLLHRDLEVESLTGPQIKGFVYQVADKSKYPFTPEARVVNVELEKALLSGEQLHIEMRYSGSIGIVGEWETNRITQEWVELGMYAPWFPYRPELTEIGFNVMVTIEAPYRVAANGVTAMQDGRWHVQSGSSDNDIVVTASKYTRTREHAVGGLSFTVHWATELLDSTVDDILSQGIAIMQRYETWFGEKESASGSMLISPREKGGGYARKNLVVLSAVGDQAYLERKNGYIRHIAHELAHNWWHRAQPDSWHDWLNESFAEYSAMMIMRDLVGEQEFADRMEAKQARISNLPPIRGLDRNDADAYSTLYDKGPVLLRELENHMGRAEFCKLLKAVFATNISTTEQFLSLLGEQTSQETLAYFSAQLDLN